MKFSPLRLLILASLVFWTTGAAHYFHESIEHASSSTSNAASHGHQGNESEKSHEDCATCKLLAHLTTDGANAPHFHCQLLPSIDRPHTLSQVAVNSELFSTAPIRGPPNLA